MSRTAPLIEPETSGRDMVWAVEPGNNVPRWISMWYRYASADPRAPYFSRGREPSISIDTMATPVGSRPARRQPRARSDESCPLARWVTRTRTC